MTGASSSRSAVTAPDRKLWCDGSPGRGARRRGRVAARRDVGLAGRPVGIRAAVMSVATREDLLARAQTFRADPLAKRFGIKRENCPRTPEDVLGARLLTLANVLEDACRNEHDERQLWPGLSDDTRWTLANLISREGLKAV